jgi:phosphonate transport system ATP-binding protein
LAHKHKITLIFTSHDMQHALQYADRVIALRNGELFFDRPSDDLTTKDMKVVFDG